MRLFVGLLAAMLVGANAPSEPAATLTYEVKFLEMEGLEWRTAHYADLQAVSRQAGATIWTAPGTIVSSLIERSTRVLASPKVVAFSGQPASISHGNVRKVLTDVIRIADGPVNRASHVEFDETISDVKEGLSVSIKGRKIDQGILVALVINDKHVVAIHPVTFSEKTYPTYTKATIQVPELTRAEVAGEWMIPNQGALVVSMGVHTVADSSGKAVVRERVAVIEASESKPTPPAPRAVPTTTTKGYINTPLTITTTSGTFPVPAPQPSTPPLPTMPTRQLPEGRDASGDPVALPPLPEVKPITSLPGSSAPCATPQGQPTKASDASAAKPATVPAPAKFLEDSLPIVPGMNALDVGKDRVDPFLNQTLEESIATVEEAPGCYFPIFEFDPSKFPCENAICANNKDEATLKTALKSDENPKQQCDTCQARTLFGALKVVESAKYTPTLPALSFSAPPIQPLDCDDECCAVQPASVATRTFTFKLPLNGTVQLKIQTAVKSSESKAKPD